MTVLSQTNKMAPQAMNGVAVQFSFTFRALVDFPDAVKAVILDTTTDTETELIYNDGGALGYTVSIDTDGVGGSITVNDAQSADYTITVYREYDETQESNYADYNAFPAETVENNYDKGIMIDQQQTELAGRALVLPITVTGVDTTLPVPEAGRPIGWNDAADGLTNYPDLVYQLQVDVDATPLYMGTTAADGVLRCGAGISKTDGGDYVTINAVPGGIDHDLLLNFVADEHIAHSGVTLTAGTGLSGGGTIAASRTFDVSADYAVITANDGTTDITAAEMETLTDGSVADALHSHTGLAVFHTLDDAYNDGVSITADAGAVAITVPDGSNTAGLIVTQNDTTNNPTALSVVNAGTGYAVEINGADSTMFALKLNNTATANVANYVRQNFVMLDDGAVERVYGIFNVKSTGIATAANAQWGTMELGVQNQGSTSTVVCLTLQGAQTGAAVTVNAVNGAQQVALIDNDYTNTALYVKQDADLIGGQYGLYVTNTVAQTGSNLARINMTNGSSNQAALAVINAGTGQAQYIGQSGDGIGLQIDNSGAKHGLYIDQSVETDAFNYGLYVYSNVAQTNSALARIRMNNVGSDKPALDIYNNSVGNGLALTQEQDGVGINLQNNGSETGLYIGQAGDLNASKYALHVYSNTQQTGSPYLVKFQQANGTGSLHVLHVDNDNASGTALFASCAGTGSCVGIQNTGNGPHFNFSGDPVVGSPADGDLWYTGTALNFYDGSSTTNLLSGGGGGAGMSYDVTQATHGFSVGDWLYLNGTTYTLAKADAIATAEAVGVVSVVTDVNTFTLQMGGRITGLSGLTAGTVYFISDATAGEITATEPTGESDISKPVLVADTTTTGYIFNWRGVEIVATEGGGYGTSFVDGDLASGVLTVTHNIGHKICTVVVSDNSDNIIVPDEVNFVDTNSLTVDLSSYGTLAGTWNVFVVGQGAGTATTLQGAFDNGETITIDDGDNKTLTLINNDTTNDPRAMLITNNSSKHGLLINQVGVLASTYRGLQVYSNGIQGTTQSLAEVRMAHTSSSSDAMQVVNYGSGNTLNLATITTAPAAGKHTLYVASSAAHTVGDSGMVEFNSNVSGTTQPIFTIIQEHASCTGQGMKIRNDGTGSGIYLEQNGTSASGQNGLHVYSDSYQNLAALVRFNMDDNTSTQPCLQVRQDGPGDAIEISNANTGPNIDNVNSGNGPHFRLRGDPTVASPTDGDLWYTGSELNFRDGSTTKDLLAGGGAWEFVSHTAETAASGLGTQISASDGSDYMLVVTFNNDDSSSNRILMRINNNSTATNYATQGGTWGSASGMDIMGAAMGTTAQGGFGQGVIYLSTSQPGGAADGSTRCQIMIMDASANVNGDDESNMFRNLTMTDFRFLNTSSRGFTYTCTLWKRKTAA